MGFIDENTVDFDTDRFVDIFWQYGLAFLIMFAAATALLAASKFRLEMLALKVVDWLPSLFPDDHLGIGFSLIFWTLVLFCALPFPMALVWGGACIDQLDPDIVGVSVIVVSFIVMLVVFSCMRWAYNGWRMDSAVKWGLLAAAALVPAFQLMLLLNADDYSFRAASAVFLGLNLAPLIVIEYTLKPGANIRFTHILDDIATSERLEQPINAALVGSLGTASVAILAAYAGITYALLDENEYVGLVTAAAVLVLDICVYLYTVSRYTAGPAAVAVVFVICRVVLVIPGVDYWFIGHSALFLIFGTTLGILSVLHRIPSAASDAELRNRLDHPHLKLGEIRRRGAHEPSSLANLAVGDGEPSSALAMVRLGWVGTLVSNFNLHSHEVVLLLLSVTFVFDLIVAASVDVGPDIALVDESYDQALYGASALVLVLVVPMLTATIRVFLFLGKRVDRLFVGLAVTTWLLVVGAGAFFHVFTESAIITVACVFLPIIVFSGVVAFSDWKLYDYSFSTPPRAWLRTENPPTKSPWTVYVAPVIFAIASAAMGLVMVAAADPAWVGWTVLAVQAIVYLSVIPIIYYFKTLYRSVWILVCEVVALVILLVYGGVMYSTTLDSDSSEPGSIAVLVFVVLWPALVLLAAGGYKWYDDGFRMTNAAMGCLIAGAVIVLGGMVVLTSEVKPWAIGCGLLLLFFIAVFGVTAVAKWRAEKYYLPVSWRRAIYVAVAVVLAVGIVMASVFPFLGFTVLLFVLFVALLAMSIQGKRMRFFHFQYSQYVFPVYKYEPTIDGLVPSNRATVLEYSALAVLLAWALGASIFMSPLWIGLGIVSIATLAMLIVSLKHATTPGIIFHSLREDIDAGVIQMAHARVQEQLQDEDVATLASSEPAHGGAPQGAALEAEDIRLELRTGKAALLQNTERLTELERQLWGSMLGLSGSKAVLRDLVDAEVNVKREHTHWNMFVLQFQLHCFLIAETNRKREEALFKKFLHDTDMSGVTADDVKDWTPEQRREYRDKMHQYLEQKRAEEIDQRKKAQEELEAERRRQETLRREEELRRLGEERAREEARRRLEAEQQRRLEAEQLRLRQQEEERRRLEEERLRQIAQAEEEERERLRREMEERRRQAAEEMARREREAQERLQREREAEMERLRQEQEAAARMAAEPEDSNHVQILKQCQATGRKFEDPSFPPSAQSMGSELAQRFGSSSWIRLGELGSNPSLTVDGVDPGDIQQGSCGDCWFLSALMVLALRDELLGKVFVTKKANKFGVYEFRFFKNGHWQHVVVDDFVPTRHSTPIFARSSDVNEMWVPLIEKAYAKLHLSYSALEGGLTHLALVDMTGGVGDTIALDSERSQMDAQSGRLWSQLLSLHEGGHLLSAGSHSGSDTDVTDMGIVLGHAYGILDVRDVDGLQLMRLRNPWGGTEWKGDWSDSSPLWTSRLKQLLNYSFTDDGTFWMSFSDFIIHYRSVYICRVFETSAWHSVSVEGEWRGATAGGCTNHKATCAGNPHYLLEVQRPTTVFVVLAQEDNRGKAFELFPISVMLLRKNGQRVNAVYRGETAGKSGPYTPVREVSLETRIEDATEPLTVFPSTFQPGQETNFRLTVFSDYPVSLRPY